MVFGGRLQTPLSLIVDIDVRWNSLYYAVRRLLELENSIKFWDYQRKDEPNYKPSFTPEHWRECKAFVELMSQFEAITLYLQGMHHWHATDAQSCILLAVCSRCSFNM